MKKFMSFGMLIHKKQYRLLISIHIWLLYMVVRVTTLIV